MDLVAASWPPGYRLVEGSTADRSRLVTTMERAYEELGAAQFSHIAPTVDQYFAGLSFLWWLDKDRAITGPRVGFTAEPAASLGCLWLGQSVNQLTGVLQAYVYLVYVAPEHRGQGLGRALMTHARKFAHDQGYGQISLQVFTHNEIALNLYASLGYEPKATWMTLDL
ncbi:GNAT family N-acetyltransferase [Leptothoe sp. PORK10 BA2]|uniref:GNAT family N-acetyltransferase n=1 Tax=Leptothoe sp. PORK10 BA2 TaxID=3110254 RepID=UPI002B1FE234|nr:N-acetyltransferase [Leptothoe sp. PORK10 BA2]MEA5463021.1 N-acetyltransferase [Leptothoe sp. PORK10 BA2]